MLRNIKYFYSFSLKLERSLPDETSVTNNIFFEGDLNENYVKNKERFFTSRTYDCGGYNRYSFNNGIS